MVVSAGFSWGGSGGLEADGDRIHDVRSGMVDQEPESGHQ